MYIKVPNFSSSVMLQRFRNLCGDNTSIGSEDCKNTVNTLAGPLVS